MKLNNVAIAPNDRIISDYIPYDENLNPGIRTHNRIGKFFADIFGSGTVTVLINEKEYYLNRGSCFNLLDMNHIDHTDKKKDFLPKLQKLFDDLHNLPTVDQPEVKHVKLDVKHVEPEIIQERKNDFSIPKGVDPIKYTTKKIEESSQRTIAQHEKNQEERRLELQEELNTLREENSKKIAEIDGKISGLLPDDPILQSKIDSYDLMKKALLSKETFQINMAKNAGIDIS